jgi:hypothetical protein
VIRRSRLFAQTASGAFCCSRKHLRVELIDHTALKVVASIDLAVERRSEIARAWSDPKGSRGEGVVLLPGGHLLVAKEKKPAAFIEFGPPGSRSRGLPRGGALADGERWAIKKGHHRFVALATWFPDKSLATTCADFSDLEIGPDGRLYLLSDQSSTIARLEISRRAAAPPRFLLRGGLALWMASRKVFHSPQKVERSSDSTHASRARISSSWSRRLRRYAAAAAPELSGCDNWLMSQLGHQPRSGLRLGDPGRGLCVS